VRLEVTANGVQEAAVPALALTRDPLAQSIIAALAYADLFEYPLTLEEIARYQIETSFSVEQLAHCLQTSYAVQAIVAQDRAFFCLRGREEVFETRRVRTDASRTVWRRAKFYSTWLARLPFVRMVAITGALAVDNIAARPDIDLLVVTTEGRVWIARRLIIGFVRLARLLGDELCPNYIISETNLNLEQQDLFTAHELAQMVPLYGKQSYGEMIARNAWATHYLPMAFTPAFQSLPSARQGFVRRLTERALSVRVLDRWERWEQLRLQRKLRPLVGDAAEVICSPQQCKGHTGLHRQWVTNRYSERLRELGF
jgi:hypothetical protein